MRGPQRVHRSLRALLLGTGLLVGLVPAIGCQVSMNGQTLPSPYYLQDDVQYFPPGPEFKLSNEAAALKQARIEAEMTR